MPQMHLIIYIPGLGKERSLARQRWIVCRWNNSNTKAIFLEPKWNDHSEGYDDKLKRLKKTITELEISKYSKITFFGTSAGGTLGLNLFSLFAHYTQTRFVCICGKLTGPNLIGAKYSKPHPALVPSVKHTVRLIKEDLKIDRKDRLLSVIPLYDEVVSNKCMKIEGARHKRQLTFLHVPSIALGITLFRRIYVR